MRRADNLNHLHVPIVLKFGNLNLLEPSGPVQACNGIASFVISDLILKKLQIIKSVDFKQERQAGTNERLKISFDLYLPSPAFRKASPGLPNYRIAVVG